MKKIVLATAVAMTLGAGIASAEADLSNGVTLSGSSTITSNYVWRGMTQSNEEPAIQGGAELSVGNLYGGIWMSSMDADDTETDYYVGHSMDLGAFTTDVGYIDYNYAATPATSDFEEYFAGLSTDVGGLTVGGKMYWGKDDATDAYDLSASTMVGDLDVGYTYNKYTEVGKSHTIGASLPLNNTFSLGATYSDFSGEDSADDQTNTAWFISAAF
jgi:uncharacterized protein (TIGR02001 family)